MTVRNPFDLRARVALVTGCGSAEGIGFASARLLAALGARVAITSTTPRIHDRERELRSDGATVFAMVGDLTRRQEAFELARRAREALGPIDVLVNAAGMAQTGIEPVSAPFVDLAPEALERELDITLKTAFHITQAALPQMLERRFGRIVMISSVTGPYVTAPGSSAYATAKGAIDGMMRTIALETGRHGITANSVAPGWIATETSPAEEIEAGKHTPVGRPGTAAEVAGLVAYLASEAASYVTGQSLIVDGGNIIQEPHGIDLYGSH